MRITWDEAKSAANRKKHGVSFEEAKELLLTEGEHLVIFDEEHSIDEDRFIAIGPIRRGLVLLSSGPSAMPTYCASSARAGQLRTSGTSSNRTLDDSDDRNT